MKPAYHGMDEQQISLKSINELRLGDDAEPRRFSVPAYQRGFRWSKLQVTQLLEDVREFAYRSNPQPEDFYCLQPLVVKSLPDGQLEVVDGQQRLTTILLLLRHFNERQVERFRQTLYSLNYETRPGLNAFLDEPTSDLANHNADFYHFYQAISAIEDWFSGHESDVEEIKSSLLNKTKVIWFQLANADNPVDAFTRLNVGKIPLTNDELIRALFLRRPSERTKEMTDVQLSIAYEWDLIEKALQADSFWYFLSNGPSKTSSRIGFLFDLVAHSQGIASEHAADAYGIFHHFNERLAKAETRPELAWRDIKKVHSTLEEWFEDRTLFHMVGFLVSDGMSINELRTQSHDCTKSGFENRLRREIFRRTMRGDLPAVLTTSTVREHVATRLDSLIYPTMRREIRQALLLFNVATLLMDDRSNIRFQFDTFKSDAWDIEHVRSVAEDKPERHDERKVWLDHCLMYLRTDAANETLSEKIDSFLLLKAPEATNDLFDPLYEEILHVFREAADGGDEQGISNLTLLDAATNRSYKNAVFAVKRQRLLSLDQAGIFVPLCTRNVFLKCYSPNVAHAMLWSEADRTGYRTALLNALEHFFSGYSVEVA